MLQSILPTANGSDMITPIPRVIECDNKNAGINTLRYQFLHFRKTRCLKSLNPLLTSNDKSEYKFISTNFEVRRIWGFYVSFTFAP
ncbi:hypothetical protein J2W97_003099 [Paenibacillus jamilae]|jgi:hypothetical protein|nr:hypothetical protein [Paenibacillus jamilae]